MRLHGQATRLTMYVGESHRWHHRPLYSEIVHRAHAANLAGAAVFRGVEGYGSSHTIHTNRILSLGEDLPMAIVIVDESQRIQDFLKQLDEILFRGLAIIEPVEVYRFTEGESPDQGTGR
jgi:uncharacterized protein